MLQTVNNKTMLTPGVYDIAKKVALIWLPAFGVLYVALASIWGLPAAEQVSGTVLAVDTFLGAVLHISAKNYDQSGAAHDGAIEVGMNQETGQPVVTLPTKEEIATWMGKDSVSLKINQAPPQQAPTPPMQFPPAEQPPVPPAN